MRQEREILISDTAMTSGRSAPQWIAPTRFHFDGEAVHLRVRRDKQQEYRDYLPIRIGREAQMDKRARSVPLPPDTDWHRPVRLKIRPRASLSQAQAVRVEYGFDDRDHPTIETRLALVFSVKRRWRLNEQSAHLEVERIEELEG